MRYLAVPVIAGTLLTLTAPVLARQNLPDTVTEPYLAYQDAIAANDAPAAFRAVLHAWQAGHAAEIPPGTLALLAENLGDAAAEIGDHETALHAWRDAAEQGEQADATATTLAWRHHNAARNGFLAGHEGEAASDAAEAVRLLDEMPQLEGEARLFAADAYGLAAQLHSRAGRFREALDPALAALQLYGEDGREPDASYAFMHYVAGLSQLMLRENAEAYYHLHMAEDISRGDPLQSELHLNADALEDLAESRSGAEFDTLIERVIDDPLHARHYSGDPAAEGPFDGEGMVDVEPVERREPRYPVNAARRGLEGVVIARFDVDETGRVVDAEIVTALPAGVFDAHVLRAMDAWRFEPARRDGVAVRRDDMSTAFTFTLREY